MQHESSLKVNGFVDGCGDKNSLDQSGSMANELVCELKADSENNVKKLDEIVRNLNNVPCVYGQDIVRHKMHNVVGVVSEVAGESDSDGSIMDDDDDSDDDDDEDAGDEGGDGDDNANGDRTEGREGGSSNYESETLQADQVRVVWMGDVKPVQHVNDVTVIDRGFLHGDYVASASDPTGQVGVVVDVNISVDLLAHDGSIIKDLSSKDLARVSEFTVGDYVVFGPWLGRVDDVVDDVTVLFDDGSVCEVKDTEPLHLKPISKAIFEEDEHFPYHPGQRVRATSSSVFKNSRWLSGLWKATRLEGTVTKVTSGSVFIYWIASASYGSDSSTTPAEEQDPKNLELLSCFAHASWQVGDWCHLPSSVVQSSSFTLDEDLLKLGIHDSAECELDSSKLGNKCDSGVAYEEVDDMNGSLAIDPVTALDGNLAIIANNESSSCGSSASVSKVPAHRRKIHKVLIRREKKTQTKEEDFERALLIVNTRTRVDIAWQDGTIEQGLNTTTLIPIDSPGDHEFVAEQYVVEKASDDVDNSFECRRVGVVKSLNAKERTACVRWLKPVARAEDPHEFDKDEIVSVYELKTHPDYDYSYGDVVVRLFPVSLSDQTSSDLETIGESKKHSRQSEIMNTQKCLGHKKGDDAPTNDVSMGSSDLSWVGNISGLRNGDLEVTWADGMVSVVGPQAIFVVGRDDGNDSVSVRSEVSEAAASWETVDDDERDGLDYTQEEVVLQESVDMNSEEEESVDYSSGRNAALNFPIAALDFVARFATGIFSRGQKNINPDFPGYKGENELHSQGTSCVSEEKHSSDESSSEKSNVNNNCGMQNTNGKEKHASVGDPGSSHAVETSCKLSTENSDVMTCSEARIHHYFKHFDSAKDPLDHHFLDSNRQINNGRKWHKKVQQDWNILQNNLPDEIYVRVYEDQMDLLRATIIGAYGTPYQDGLFFFDFHLPPEYPDAPPSAHYHSGGWRINPNLYEEGKVCLSLLNTWTGRGNEVWHSSSSILQVLVSLQGLVLNSRPYFNEAGYDKQIGTAEGEKNSLSYNENTFLLNCKTMMYLMRKPPKDFEDLVKKHFRRRGYYILKACDAYMQGNLIGSLARDASVSSKESSNLTSVGFKLMLAKIVPKLYLALNEVGADCHEFKHLLQS